MGIGGIKLGMVVGISPGFIGAPICGIIWKGAMPKKFCCIIIGCAGKGKFIAGGCCCLGFLMVLLNCYRYCLDM